MKNLRVAGICLLLGLSLLAGCGGGGSALPLGGPRSTPSTPPLIFPASGALAAGQVGKGYVGWHCWIVCCPRTECAGGEPISANFGVQPYTASWVAAAGSTLPPGLDLCSCGASTAAIVGFPTTAGTYNFLVTVSDSESPPQQASANYTITVTP